MATTSYKKNLFNTIIIFLLLTAIATVIFTYSYYTELKKELLLRISSKITSLIGQEITIGDFSFGLPGDITIKKITIKNPPDFKDGELLKVSKVTVSMHLRRLFKGEYSVRYINIESPVLTVLRNMDGNMNISEGLKKFLSKKGTTKYNIDRIKISDGSFSIDKGKRYTLKDIDITLKDMSSQKDTKTFVKAEACYAENKFYINGWAYLKDTKLKMDISLTAKDINTAIFREFFDDSKIFKDTTIDININVSGDKEAGLDMKTIASIKRIRSSFLKKDLPEIRLNSEMFLNISSGSLNIRELSLRSGDISEIKATGIINNILNKPYYNAEIMVKNFDLSKIKIIRDATLSGIITSEKISLKGTYRKMLPEISGTIKLTDGSMKSPFIDMDHLNAECNILSAKRLSLNGLLSVKMHKVRDYLFKIPAEARMTFKGYKEAKDIAFNTMMDISPLELIIKNQPVTLKRSNIEIDGKLQSSKLSGKITARSEHIGYGSFLFKDVNSSFNLLSNGGLLHINNLRITGDGISAKMAGLKIYNSNPIYKISLNDLVLYSRQEDLKINAMDFNLTLDREKTGTFHFISQKIQYKDIESKNVSGSGRFDSENFSITIPSFEIFKGKATLSFDGNTKDIYPIKVDFFTEDADLGRISHIIHNFKKLPYSFSGRIEKAALKGTIDRPLRITGKGMLSGSSVSVINTITSMHIIKDASISATADLKGDNIDFISSANIKDVQLKASGNIKDPYSDNMLLTLKTEMPETQINEIRAAMWDIFPDKLLYAGMDGAISFDMSIAYKKDRSMINGKFRFNNLKIEGENGEYSLGPINGLLPISYNSTSISSDMLKMPSFDHSSFETAKRDFEKWIPPNDYSRINMGSIRYGFRLLDDVNIWLKHSGQVLNIGKVSANIFGGKLYGYAAVDLSNNTYYGGALLHMLSLSEVCDAIEPIKGYISGKVDGVALFKGTGIGISKLIGIADFWTYSSSGEKTKISRKFLQKVGGPAVKAYLGDRKFNRGIMSLYIDEGYVVFNELEISNRNIFGIQDLSVKVAPLNNRIAIDHLLWTMLEAAQRAKKE